MSNLKVRELTPDTAPADLFGADGWTAGSDPGSAVLLVPGVTVGWDGTTVAVVVDRDVTQPSVERLNATLRGLGRGAPRLASYWRAAQEPDYADRLRVNVDGKVLTALKLPVSYIGERQPDGTVRWDVTSSITTATYSVRASAPAAMVNRTHPAAEPKVAAPIQDRPATVKATPVVVASATPGDVAIFETPAQTLKPFKVYHDPEVANTLKVALAEHKALGGVTVALFGPTGVGKSLTASQMAAEAGLPFLKVDAMGMNTFADWMGARDLVETPEGNVITTFVPSLFCKAIDAAGPMAGIKRMVLVDEANRGSHTASMNVFLPIADGTGTIYVPDAGRTIRIDPAVLFVLTANIGAQYGGTQELDAALVNRVDFIETVPYPTPEVEAKIVVEQGGCTLDQARLLVRVAAQVRAMSGVSIRQPGVATRQLVKAGRHVKYGMSLIQAAEKAFVGSYDEGAARKAVRDAANSILQGA